MSRTDYDQILPTPYRTIQLNQFRTIQFVKKGFWVE
jgi:hypothetical protein